MPVPRKPGLSDRAIQVLQTETGKWNLEKEGTQNKGLSPLLNSFCSRQCKYIPIKDQQWSTGNSHCSKHDSFVWSGISWLLQRPINSGSAEGNGRFAIDFNGILAAPLTLCANRFFKTPLLTLKIVYCGTDFSQHHIHLPPLCPHLFYLLLFNSHYSSQFLLLCKFQHLISNLFKSPTILNSAEIMFCLEAFKWQCL